MVQFLKQKLKSYNIKHIKRYIFRHIKISHKKHIKKYPNMNPLIYKEKLFKNQMENKKCFKKIKNS